MYGVVYESSGRPTETASLRCQAVAEAPSASERAEAAEAADPASHQNGADVARDYTQTRLQRTFPLSGRGYRRAKRHSQVCDGEGVHALLPPIEVVEASYCNANPEDRREWEDGLERKLGPGEPALTIREAPFVQVPLGVTEDRLLGTVDVEASMKEGRTVFQPGLLAEANRGVLYVDEINLLDEGIANLLLSVLSDGVNVVEREGLSVTHPCKPLLIATYNPEEGALREHLLDRISINLSADVPPTFDDRVAAVDIATRFQDESVQLLQDSDDMTEGLKSQVLFAREYLRGCQDRAQADRAAGHRSHQGGASKAIERAVCRPSRQASAALDGRDAVTPDDIQKAIQLQKALGKTGKSKNLIYSEDRGRYIKPMFPKGESLPPPVST
ncbi:hypothetical protein WJX84_000424 [Apatococcus fuscideae]|uniref:magnesium chelatase n=1 Tax=Apatococcus fuscideae TaxID=2026836 RepID=A0AAW1SXG8_9CHLO